MSDWIFPMPWWLPTLIAAAGVIVSIEGNRRTRRPMRNAGAIIVLAAIALSLVSYFVVTDKEKVAKLSHQLVDAVKTQQWDTVSNLLEPDAVVSLPEAGPLYHNADQIVDAAKMATSTYPLDGTSIQSLKLEQVGTDITATMTLMSVIIGQPVPSTWQLDWVKDGDTWRVREIHVIQIGERTGPDMGQILPRK
jgi:hypothetical protein